jgi:small-conductance mechanosensitive channel
VAYNSDPEQVIALLKTCADNHPDVLRTPAPMAFFENFGDSALMFTLRISLPDIAQAASVQSDLRTTILKALRAAEIEIPFNQLDINLRELDGAKRYLANRMREAAANVGPPTGPETLGASNGKRLRGAAE